MPSGLATMMYFQNNFQQRVIKKLNYLMTIKKTGLLNGLHHYGTTVNIYRKLEKIFNQEITSRRYKINR